jgi:hypothetical protein
MPAPTKNEIVSKARSLLQDNDIEGENMPDLADALGDAVAQALTQMLTMVKVAPGISVPPPAGPSATPGRLL